MKLNSFFQNIGLAQKKQQPSKKRFLPYDYKSVNRVRQDIQNWNNDLDLAKAEDPYNWPLQLLYEEIMLDAHLTSQIENRKQQVLAADFTLKKDNGDIDDEQTDIIQSMNAYKKLTSMMLDSRFFGYSMAELSMNQTDNNIDLMVDAIPRTNIVPQKGWFFKDYSETFHPINYREMPEYGRWILEFIPGTSGQANFDFGLLNKAVPHVLFKRFAQSCWSELCEIYGIPPRVMKTNTQDGVLLKRAEQMMKDMGAAAWFIIDETEKFEWAQGVDTNGDVYKNLMQVCRNEISLLISGAVIGQDTENGNRSKEEVSMDMLKQLMLSDMLLVEGYWNDIVIPALVEIGILKTTAKFEFDPAEDIDQLFKFTKGFLPFKEVDNDWIKNKFGVEVTGDKQQEFGGGLKADNDFFV